MVRVFIVSIVCVSCALLYAACSPLKTVVDAETEQTQIVTDGRVQVAAEDARAQVAEGQALLEAARSANQTAQMAAQQNTQNIAAFASTLLAVTNQNSALSSQIISAQNSVPGWVMALIIVLVIATLTGLMIGGAALYSMYQATLVGLPPGNRQIAARVEPATTYTERMLMDKKVPFQRQGDLLITVVDGVKVSTPNI